MCILAQQEVTVAWTRVAVESRRQNWGQSQQNLLMCVGRFGVREKKQDRLFKSHLLQETFLWFHSYEVEELNVIPCSGSPATLHPFFLLMAAESCKALASHLPQPLNPKLPVLGPAVDRALLKRWTSACSGYANSQRAGEVEG